MAPGWEVGNSCNWAKAQFLLSTHLYHILCLNALISFLGRQESEGNKKFDHLRRGPKQLQHSLVSCLSSCICCKLTCQKFDQVRPPTNRSRPPTISSSSRRSPRRDRSRPQKFDHLGRCVALLHCLKAQLGSATAVIARDVRSTLALRSIAKKKLLLLLLL